MATSFAEPAQQLSSEESNFFVLEGVRRDERCSHAAAPDLSPGLKFHFVAMSEEMLGSPSCPTTRSPFQRREEALAESEGLTKVEAAKRI